MNKSSTIFLQGVIVLIGIASLAFMLWEPHLEGRNVHATLFEIYFKDPFLAYAYIASLPFFVVLYQAFKVLGYARLNKVFSPEVRIPTKSDRCSGNNRTRFRELSDSCRSEATLWEER